MMSKRKRILILAGSILIGTLLSYLLLLSKKGTLGPGDYGTLFVNMFLAAAIVVGIGFIFRKKKDRY